MAPQVGPVLLLFGLIRIVVAVTVSAALVYLLIKLAGLVDAMRTAKQSPHRSIVPQVQPASKEA